MSENINIGTFEFEFEYDTTQIPKYREVVNNLNQHGYVPFFRFFQRVNFDFKEWHLSSDEEVYLQDSVAYYSAHEAFFDQEKEFLYWLMDFKNDTIIDSTSLRRNLWQPFFNPYLSTISPCQFLASNSRQAINLVYGFLDGESIICVECQSGNPSCTFSKYETVERFLSERREMEIEQLRQEWEEYNKLER